MICSPPPIDTVPGRGPVLAVWNRSVSLVIAPGMRETTTTDGDQITVTLTRAEWARVLDKFHGESWMSYEEEEEEHEFAAKIRRQVER